MFLKRSSGLLGLLGLVLLAGLTTHSALAQNPNEIEVIVEDHHDFSRPLRDVEPAHKRSDPPREIPLGRPHPGAGAIEQADPVVQKSAAPSPLAPTLNAPSILGVGKGFTGPEGTFTVDAAPPDTNGAVGSTQYVQWVNESFAVFDKATGAVLLGPVAGNTLWSGFGGGCETNNDGDPIVQYDKAANRWIFTQFSVSTTPYLQCFAISDTSDATGSYHRYALGMSAFPDYPKLGVWPDAYYITFNMFTSVFVGAKVCALDRTAMLNGDPATAQCVQLSSSYASLLPSDLDGATPPPAGAPNYLLNFGTNSLRLWKFHVDWANSANSTFTGPTSIPVAAFTRACGGGACIPQRGTKNKLDSLGDRLMYRLAYRNFGDHESLVVNHSVAAGSSSNSNAGIRWYELRDPGGTPTVFQQGTYAPDSNYRWMGSIAMDQDGNIAVGYSVSGANLYPAIRYTGRLSTDLPLGKLQAETSIIEGAGSQSQPLNRWGDYSSISVDPVDDCTFWYTNEYLQSSGKFNWSTRIASFKFPTCGP
jgi:hypothetical protein